jgi:glycosyltransferase involved in cell wall biosynthesis
MNSLNSEFEPKDRILEVDVLLATFNGAKYIQQQLDSLSNQINVVINLFISDDGSSDSTIEIIQGSSCKFKSLVFLSESPKLGPAANFIYLMKNFRGTAKYIALMDQDDIWNPNHLLLSINELKKSGEKAALTFSSCTEIGGKVFGSKLWPSKRFNLDTHLIYFENPCRGCTVVLNRSAIDLVRIHNPVKIIMHDWWLLILINELGNVYHLKTPTVIYRIHPNNHTGRRSSFSRVIQSFGLLKIKNWRTIEQVMDISSEIVENSQSISIEMKDLVRMLECRNLRNRVKILTLKKKLRTSRVEDAILRMLLLVIP